MVISSAQLGNTTEVGSAEVYFAKKLANNEKKVRDRALKKLRVWLVSKSSKGNDLSESDLLKLWKGLFYCMWFSDKPLVQEELASDLSKIVHVFTSDSSGAVFLGAFMTTIAREWNGIDRLRLDKFYMMVKKFFHETFEFYCARDWNLSCIAQVSEGLSALFASQRYPDELKKFYCEYIIPELSGFVVERQQVLSSDQILAVLDPYFQLLATSSSGIILRAVREEVFSKLYLLQESKGEEINKLQVPYTELIARLSEMAMQKSLKTKNRKMVYKLIDGLRPFEEENKERQTAVVTRKRKSKKVKTTGRKKLKVVAEDGDSLNSTEINITAPVQSEILKVKKKKSMKAKAKVLDEPTLDNAIVTSVNEQSNDDDQNSNADGKGNAVQNALETASVPEVLKVKKKKKTKTKAKEHDQDVSIPANTSSVAITSEADDINTTETVIEVISLPLSGYAEQGVSVEEYTECVESAETADLKINSSMTDEQSNVETDDCAKTLLFDDVDDAPEEGLINEKTAQEETINHHEESLVVNTEDDRIGAAISDIRKSSTKKKRKYTAADTKTAPKPFLEFLKKNTPRKSKAFSKSASKADANVESSKKTQSKLPATSAKKRVSIQLSQNMAIGHKELKINPESPFSPTKRPSKSAIKTRSKASDFF